MKTATYIRDISGMSGVVKLYRLSEPAAYSDGGTTEYVAVSKIGHWTTETYIFPADADGRITEWGEMNGSQKGEVSHERALNDAGYEVV